MFAVEAEQPSVRTTASVRMGLLMRFAAPQHLTIICCVNVRLSLWKGMVDRRIPYANTKLTSYLCGSTNASIHQHASMQGSCRLFIICKVRLPLP
jgi:hypothetical protein